jgi:Arc/MetJ-type ribon-helix-helix transcriptional regulator
MFTLGGATTQATPRFQVNVYADDAGSAESVSEAVRAALNDWRSSTGSVNVRDTEIRNEVDTYDEATETHGVMLDFLFMHDE